MKKRYYIAYGSNLNIRQMRMRCPLAQIIGTAEISDYELLFKGSQSGAYLTIEPKIGASVPVAVWSVTAEDEAALDCYEGFPTFYYKKEIQLPIKGIKSGRIRTRDCFVYIMHEERSIGIPSLAYVSVCLEGYISFGFDEHFLSEAQIKSEEVVKDGKNRNRRN
ncbi:MAG: gamma-glutamylcyclotransferase family protein [Erysipelotrichaceae bacterium]